MRKNKALLKMLSNPAVIRSHYSPSIYRTIPGQVPHYLKVNEWLVVAAVSGILLFLILQLSLQINRQITELGKKQATRDTVVRELLYWQKLTAEYPAYRDGYFRVALLEYQLGEEANALSSVNKALLLDPRFEAGRAFKEKILANKN